MKNIIVVFILIFCLTAYAAQARKLDGSYTTGVFKKNKKGEYVQYDKKGKKIGVYKLTNGKFVKIK